MCVCVSIINKHPLRARDLIYCVSKGAQTLPLRERTAHARGDQNRKRHQPQQTFQPKHRFHNQDQKRQHEELQTVVERIRVVGFVAVEQIAITYQERDHARGRQHALEARTHVCRKGAKRGRAAAAPSILPDRDHN